MSKELDYIQRHIDIVKQQVKCSKMKIIVTDVITNHQYDYYENELQTLESIEQALQRLEAIDNSNPSEALECLEVIEQDIKDRVILAEDRQLKLCAVIKQALLKAQEPKKYLKWEDLEFSYGTKIQKVKMNDTIYKIAYVYYDNTKEVHLLSENETLLYCIFIEKYNDNVQLFNDLHLEKVEE